MVAPPQGWSLGQQYCNSTPGLFTQTNVYTDICPYLDKCHSEIWPTQKMSTRTNGPWKTVYNWPRTNVGASIIFAFQYLKIQLDIWDNHIANPNQTKTIIYMEVKKADEDKTQFF